MTTLTNNVAEALEGTATESHLHPAGSFDLDDHPVPHGLEEVWRFTPLKRLKGLHDGTFTTGGWVATNIDADPSVGIELVGRDDVRLGSVHKPSDRISAQAWDSFEKAFVLTIPKDAEVENPITITLDGQGADQAAFGHVFIEVGDFAKATVLMDHTGSALVAANVEIKLGDGANLTVVSIQDWADDAVHVAHHHATVGRDATYKHAIVSFGGSVVRINATVDYAGPGGDVNMLGLYFADAGQHLEHRLFVDHNQPKTRSRVEYKGALQGKDAHTVWIGDVLIRNVAEGIDTYESNDNLVLTDGCRADSVPNLEIETGEIEGAGHASTTGRFDDEHLFYLQSRGIPETEARRLVVHGFFADIVRRIGVPQLEERLLAAVERELSTNIGTIA